MSNFPQQWFSSEVLRGDQLGRTIDFPTLNMHSHLFESFPELEKGVYAVTVKHDSQEYYGALFYGPRKVLQEVQDVIEIFVLDFSQEIYGQSVEFLLHAYVRPVFDFDSFAEMKEQLEADKEAVSQVFLLSET